MQLEFGGVLDGDDALVAGDEAGQDVEGGGLAGPGAAADQDVQPALDTGGEDVGDRAGEGAETDQVVDLEGVGGELADGQQGASTASGGMIALIREPSGRRASTMGEASSTRRPTRPTILSMVRRRCPSSVKRPSTG